MLTLKLISEETERVIRGLKKKHFKDAEKAIENVLDIDKCRREAQQKSDKIKQETKQLSAQVGALMKQGLKAEAEEIKSKVQALKQTDKELQEKMESAEKELHDVLCTIPNIPNEYVPEGASATDNIVVKEGGIIPEIGRAHV